MCSRCLLYKGKGLIPLNSTLEKIYGRFEVKIREKILDFSQIISCYFFWGLYLWKSTPFPYKTNIWEHFKSIEWVLGFIPWKEIRKPSAPLTSIDPILTKILEWIQFILDFNMSARSTSCLDFRSEMNGFGSDNDLILPFFLHFRSQVGTGSWTCDFWCSI